MEDEHLFHDERDDAHGAENCAAQKPGGGIDEKIEKIVKYGAHSWLPRLTLLLSWLNPTAQNRERSAHSRGASCVVSFVLRLAEDACLG